MEESSRCPARPGNTMRTELGAEVKVVSLAEDLCWVYPSLGLNLSALQTPSVSPPVSFTSPWSLQRGPRGLPSPQAKPRRLH